jgi:photosystem II stability/assembly factor-like uncharacterized protein
VFFLDPDLGWVVNGAGEIFHTSDGGESWVRQALEPVYLRSVGFASPTHGWVGSLEPSPLLYATTNGGALWTQVSNIPAPQPTGICGIWVVNPSIVYACGRYDGPPRLIKTTNGGASWTSSDLSAHATTLIDCFFFDASNGFLVGGIGSTFNNRRAVVLATTDGGATWETRHTGTRQAEWCWKITFPSPTIGYVSIERFAGQSYFLKTTDGGQSWQEFIFLDDYSEQGIGFVSPTLGWIGGHEAPTYESTDAGATWQPAGFGVNINRFRFLSETLGYAVGETVYKYSAETTGIEADEIALESPAAILGRNHPNPFRSSTSIPFVLGRSADVKLTVHDAQGRTIRALLDGRRAAGTHVTSWDARDRGGQPVPAGVYWLRLDAGGDRRSAKVLVVK